MSKEQIAADKAEAQPNCRRPDDCRQAGPLHRTNGQERRHRDRGNAQDSSKWRESVRRERD
jgi:hypothetical protein